MGKSRFTEAQIAYIFDQADAAVGTERSFPVAPYTTRNAPQTRRTHS